MPAKKEDPWMIVDYKIYAEVCGEIYKESGLGYHCDVDLWVTGLSGGRRWDVDHLASGARIASFNAQARARVFIEEIASYTDWTVSVVDLQEQEEVLRKVQKAVAFASSWTPKETKRLLQLRKQVNVWKESVS
jgi:hypothetical protein